MIKILAYSPIPFDGTSFYRAYGIFPNLHKKMGRNLDVTTFRGGFTWADVGSFDVLFLQRPMTEQIMKLATYAKSLGVKVWTDFDDNLFELPPESRAFFDFHDEVRKVMMRILQVSDVVTVSTPALKEYFELYKVKNIEVVPNALNDDWFTPAREHNATSKDIVWRGSETHVADLIYFNEQITRAIGNTDDTFHFLGYLPFLVAHQFETYAKGLCGTPEMRVHAHKPEDIKIYHENLQSIAPRLMHVPLIGNALNIAKSNIAWIEATFAGAVCIAPKWAEWEKPGVLTYSSQEEFESLLTSTMNYTKEWEKSMEYIKKNLLLSHVNEQRATILERLIK